MMVEMDFPDGKQQVEAAVVPVLVEHGASNDAGPGGIGVQVVITGNPYRLAHQDHHLVVDGSVVAVVVDLM